METLDWVVVTISVVAVIGGWLGSAFLFGKQVGAHASKTQSDIAVVSTKIDEHKNIFDNTCGDLKSDIREIRDQVFTIVTGKSISTSNSPTVLTEYGLEVAKQIDADSLVAKYAKKVDIADNMNAFEIQQACRHFALSEDMLEFSLDELDRLQGLAFDEGVTIDLYRGVLALLFRDWWLKKRDMMPVEIDKHDPSSSTTDD